MSRVLMTEKKIDFIRFFFEGNQYVRLIENKVILNDLMFFYNFDILKKARVNPRTQNKDFYIISFGFYNEYNGELTLGEWIEKNNMKSFFQK